MNYIYGQISRVKLANYNSSDLSIWFKTNDIWSNNSLEINQGPDDDKWPRHD